MALIGGHTKSCAQLRVNHYELTNQPIAKLSTDLVSGLNSLCHFLPQSESKNKKKRMRYNLMKTCHFSIQDQKNHVHTLTECSIQAFKRSSVCMCVCVCEREREREREIEHACVCFGE